ncbi:MAG TPA: glycosyltransferase [Mycobacteriales bacterium]|nr:glycosyltransferase [Mycobacteriales bacterium]
MGTPPDRTLACLEESYLTPTVSVVVPALNEGRNLQQVFGAIPAWVLEVILVDGHSVDDTVEVARRCRPDVRVILQNRRGKGNALACGFAAARGDIVVMLDCDGSTDPAEIPDFVSALRNGADFAKGSRFVAGGYSHDITRVRRMGNSFLNALVKTLFAIRFTDLCYGYNAFWRDLVPAIGVPVGEAGEPVWGDGFEIETLMNIRVARTGARIVEVPSIEYKRLSGASNLRAWRDGLRVLRTIVRERRRSAVDFIYVREAAIPRQGSRPVVLPDVGSGHDPRSLGRAESVVANADGA